MLKITVPETEFWDPRNEVFVPVKARTLQMEHSLVSISKWESKWEKAYLKKQQKTDEEALDYIRCMTVTPNVDPIVYYCLSVENLKEIDDYIAAPMTASHIHSNVNSEGTGKDVLTSDLIYYYMTAFNIPFECQKWHLNRLLTLIRICEVKNKNPKQRNLNSVAESNTALNAARRKMYNSKG